MLGPRSVGLGSLTAPVVLKDLRLSGRHRGGAGRRAWRPHLLKQCARGRDQKKHRSRVAVAAAGSVAIGWLLASCRGREHGWPCLRRPLASRFSLHRANASSDSVVARCRSVTAHRPQRCSRIGSTRSVAARYPAAPLGAATLMSGASWHGGLALMADQEFGLQAERAGPPAMARRSGAIQTRTPSGARTALIVVACGASMLSVGGAAPRRRRASRPGRLPPASACGAVGR